MKVLWLLPFLGGCASWTHETIAEESAYQVLAAVDGYQTVHRGACRETGPIARSLVGSNPSTTDTVTFRAISSVLHFGVTGMLSDWKPGWVRVWEGLTLVDEGRSVSLNFQSPCGGTLR